MDKRIKISVALIVKNEEPILAECLESVKDADEIIVVDTGSTDNTVEIAKQFTDNIYHFKWCDDFAKARNYAKEQCTGDWILSIDADHVLKTPIDKVREEIAKSTSDVLKIKSRAGKHLHYREVLFKNDPSIFWVGRIHECINKHTSEVVDVERECGYSKNHFIDKDRNIRILEKSEKTPRTLFYLGREHFERDNYTEAEQNFLEYIKNNTWNAEKAEAYLCLAKICWWTQRGNEARQYCLQAINQNPMFKEALLLMSEMHYEPNKTKWKKIADVADNTDVLFMRA